MWNQQFTGGSVHNFIVRGQFVFSHLGDGDFLVEGFVLSSQKAR